MMGEQQDNRDPVIEEIHRTRREIADNFDGDIAAILEDARQRQAESGRPLWQAAAPPGETVS